MGPKPNFIRPLGQGFPAKFEYITRYKQMVHGLFSLQFFQGFRLLWVASAKMLKKLQFPYFSHCSKALFL